MEFNAAWWAGLSPDARTRIRQLARTRPEDTARAFAMMQDRSEADGRQLVAHYDAACEAFPRADYVQLFEMMFGGFGRLRTMAKNFRCPNGTMTDSKPD